MSIVERWGENGTIVVTEEPDLPDPGEGSVWTWGADGQPVAVQQVAFEQADPGPNAEGEVWVWGEDGQPVAVPIDTVPAMIDLGGEPTPDPPPES